MQPFVHVHVGAVEQRVALAQHDHVPAGVEVRGEPLGPRVVVLLDDGPVVGGVLGRDRVDEPLLYLVGQGGTGPRLAPRPLPAPALTAYVRKPGNGMPPYSAKVMSDAEVADIRAYLATIPEPPKDIPLLKP